MAHCSKYTKGKKETFVFVSNSNQHVCKGKKVNELSIEIGSRDSHHSHFHLHLSLHILTTDIWISKQQKAPLQQKTPLQKDPTHTVDLDREMTSMKLSYFFFNITNPEQYVLDDYHTFLHCVVHVTYWEETNNDCNLRVH